MEKVIVTGGAGFIGSHVVERLIEGGCFVTLIDNFRTGQESNLARFKPGSFTLIRDDVLSIAKHTATLGGHSTIFHLAAEVGNINSIANPAMDATTNILGTIAVCEFARRNRLKIIYSSSSAIYGETVHLPVPESHQTLPASPYGLSKLAGELYVRMYGALHGVTFACLRYFNAYGEGQLFNPYSNVIPIFVEKLLRGDNPVLYGDGTQTRDFVHVKDIAQANWLAYRSNRPGEVFNVGTGKRSSLQDLITILKEIHGDFTVQHEPPRLGEVRDSVADISAISSALNFAPRYDLTAGVRSYYHWRNTTIQQNCARQHPAATA